MYIHINISCIFVFQIEYIYIVLCGDIFLRMLVLQYTCLCTLIYIFTVTNMYVEYLTCASMLDPNGFPKLSNGGLRHTNLGYSTSTPLIFMEVRWTFGSKWCFFFRRCWIDDTSDAFFTYSIYVYLRTVNLKKVNLEIMLSSHSRWGETGWRLSPGFRPWNLCPKIFLRSVRHLDRFWYMISLIFFANHENSLIY